jgi:hypothetical protein
MCAAPSVRWDAPDNLIDMLVVSFPHMLAAWTIPVHALQACNHMVAPVRT